MLDFLVGLFGTIRKTKTTTMENIGGTEMWVDRYTIRKYNSFNILLSTDTKTVYHLDC
jgi:hypothetical protein